MARALGPGLGKAWRSWDREYTGRGLGLDSAGCGQQAAYQMGRDDDAAALGNSGVEVCVVRRSWC